MPTISISISGSTAVSLSQDHPVSDTDLTKVVAWARATYPSTATPDTRTDAQVMAQWAQSFTNGTASPRSRFWITGTGSAFDRGTSPDWRSQRRWHLQSRELSPRLDRSRDADSSGRYSRDRHSSRTRRNNTARRVWLRASSKYPRHRLGCSHPLLRPCQWWRRVLPPWPVRKEPCA